MEVRDLQEDQFLHISKYYTFIVNAYTLIVPNDC